ncbi:hypothetical protein BC939DRAFT_391887 [Gamsiella multidivaricata]|uniref:uncharacterized protein n=1 Tax=Gamsiella multidivaricata TaxID=101098 RepID=UPI00221E69B2|nr:uncharacterized protein BC939DRAFT_391887 [Gamsiella multidivaricata]KAI7831450.1 hypothetical protein BC939DRAFT_391887 [Gamsiella multidivaricata]
MLYPGVAFGLAIFVGYLLLVRHLRYQRINALLKKYPDPTLPLRDRNVAKEVSSNFADIDFPFLNVVSLEFALFKTYAIPSISKILAATRQFKDSCSKRTEDTTLILQEMSEGYARKQFREIIERRVDEEEDKNDERREFIATERLNFIHGHYPIKQEDYLYTLALFVLEPHIWISRFEWRESTELERNEYERSHMVYANTNVAIAEVTTDLLLSLAPSFTHAFGRQVVSALLSDRLRTAFAIPPPPAGLTTVIVGALKLRAFFVRHFMLPRRYPNVRTALRANEENKYVPLWNKYAPVYPDGYKVEDLGPAKFLGKCPMSLKGIVQDTTHVESRFKAV